MEENVILYYNKSQCCGCSACKNACPINAISMEEDEYGFLYPVINEYLCVRCGKCKKVCSYQKRSVYTKTIEVYAAATKDQKILMSSASGGVFSSLAKEVILNGGVVYGSAFEQMSSTLIPKHIRINSINNISRLQGSKYVQSDIELTYKDAEMQLRSGNIVLFSGTPCQIAGLKGYLEKDYENLFTVDIICHGVPNAKLFQDYVALIMKKWKGTISDFRFRDKENGWGLNAKVTYRSLKGKTLTKRIPFKLSSYYDMFIKGETYRENCYTCPYANENRVGDITLGDYWGIQREHPELMTIGKYSDDRGVSCILVNTDKGLKLLQGIESTILFDKSTLEKVSRENEQLKHSSNCPDCRDNILHLYHDSGYKAVENYFNKRTGMKKYFYYIKSMVPRSVKKNIKNILKRTNPA